MLQELSDVTGSADCDNAVDMPQNDMRYPDVTRVPKTKDNDNHKDNEETSSRCKGKTDLVHSTSRNSTVFGEELEHVGMVLVFILSVL